MENQCLLKVKAMFEKTDVGRNNTGDYTPCTVLLCYGIQHSQCAFLLNSDYKCKLTVLVHLTCSSNDRPTAI